MGSNPTLSAISHYKKIKQRLLGSLKPNKTCAFSNMLQGRFNQDDLFRGFYGSWLFFRAVIHVAFLDDTKFSQKVDQEGKLARAMATASEGAEKEKIASDLNYIALLKKAYEHYNSGMLSASHLAFRP